MLEINFITAKIHQLGIHHRKTRLTRGLCNDPCDQVTSENGLHVIVHANHLDHVHILRIADLRDDVIWLGAASRIVGESQHGLDDIGVGIAIFRGQYDDDLCIMRIGDFEIIRVNRASASTNNARLSADLKSLPDLISPSPPCLYSPILQYVPGSGFRWQSQVHLGS